MPPGQRQPKPFSVLNVAGQSSFNIMWHYAQVAERNPRATHIMSAPFNAWARCGPLRQRCAAGRRGSALGAVWRTARRLALLRTSRPCFGFHSVAALPGGAGSGVSLQATSTSRSTPQQKPLLRHGA
ncbi:hypothetical protein IG609_004600 [Pectobacterium quasiaquaticum]|uniref:Uncharacterized protein n=1 Tax=Pectobacterium quasiaquaticum TaxID=2774015 RepID=A0A9Q2IE75_9GAMM|nr:hypothetical protein [Pectobacterium quasiaquaticum]URG49847.1 hypothetical protein IG609_004600 [Pectobacterium quasiaquaticum]